MNLKEFEKRYNVLLKQLADTDDPEVLRQMSELMDEYYDDATAQYPEITQAWEAWDGLHRAMFMMQELVQKTYCSVFGVKQEAFDVKHRFSMSFDPVQNTINCIIDFGHQSVSLESVQRFSKALGSPEFVMVPDGRSVRPRMFMKFNLLTSKVMGYFLARRFVCFRQAGLDQNV